MEIKKKRKKTVKMTPVVQFGHEAKYDERVVEDEIGNADREMMEQSLG